MGVRKDLSGQSFGRLFVIEPNGKTKGNNIKWLCICECGNDTTVIGFKLTSGQTKSCGCLTRETATRHGMSKSYEFNSYRKLRLTGHHYWTNFQAFITDVGLRPSNKHKLLRTDNRLPHSKTNTKWRNPNERTDEQNDGGTIPNIGLITPANPRTREAGRSREETTGEI